MKRIVLIFGTISGVVISSLMFLTTYLCTKGIVDFDNGEVIGYTGILIAFLLVFFGVRSYRDQVGGSLSFGRAFKVGILIALISSAFYVASWQVVYFGNLMPGFMEQWTAHAVEEMRKEGATPAAIEAKRQEMAKFKEYYDNPLINAAFTFIEPFPMGVLASLISAAILRRRSDGSATAEAVA
jgi:Protein of unknown function (DUF4199)